MVRQTRIYEKCFTSKKSRFIPAICTSGIASFFINILMDEHLTFGEHPRIFVPIRIVGRKKFRKCSNHFSEDGFYEPHSPLLLGLFIALGSTSFAQSIRIPLRVAANSGAYDTLWFGVDTAATFCVDPD
jgi:hypothetical protein